MTKEEVIRIATGLRTDFKCESDTMVDFCNTIIKTFEREFVLDKIRAEIESQRKEVGNKNSENAELQAFYDGLNDGLKDARDIIDKYKAESVDRTNPKNIEAQAIEFLAEESEYGR